MFISHLEKIGKMESNLADTFNFCLYIFVYFTIEVNFLLKKRWYIIFGHGLVFSRWDSGNQLWDAKWLWVSKGVSWLLSFVEENRFVNWIYSSRVVMIYMYIDTYIYI